LIQSISSDKNKQTPERANDYSIKRPNNQRNHFDRLKAGFCRKPESFVSAFEGEQIITITLAHAKNKTLV